MLVSRAGSALLQLIYTVDLELKSLAGWLGEAKWRAGEDGDQVQRKARDWALRLSKALGRL